MLLVRHASVSSPIDTGSFGSLTMLSSRPLLTRLARNFDDFVQLKATVDSLDWTKADSIGLTRVWSVRKLYSGWYQDLVVGSDYWIAQAAQPYGH